MTQEEKRIKIARSCGIEMRQNEPSDGLWGAFKHGEPMGLPTGLSEDHAWRVCAPYYFDDLNACHEMEQHIQINSAAEYARILADMNGAEHFGIRWALVSATAAQKCEAFGLTLKLWEAGE